MFGAEYVDDLCVEDILEIINEDKNMDSDDISYLFDLYDENNNEVDKSTQEIEEQLRELPEVFMADSEQFINLCGAGDEDTPAEFCSRPHRANLKLNITNPAGGQLLINGIQSLVELNTPDIVQDVIQLQQNFPPSSQLVSMGLPLN